MKNKDTKIIFQQQQQQQQPRNNEANIQQQQQQQQQRVQKRFNDGIRRQQQQQKQRPYSTIMFDSSSSSSSMKINTANNLARITYIDDDSSYDDDDDGVDICIDSLDLNVFDIDDDDNKTIKKLNVFKNDDYSDDDDDNEIEKLPVINEDPLEQQQQQPFQQNPQLCINNDRMIITTATNVSSPSINDDDVNSMQTSSSKLMGKKRISSKLNSNAREFLQNNHHSSSSSIKKIDIHLTPKQKQLIDEKINSSRQRKQRQLINDDSGQFENNNNNDTDDTDDDDERDNRLSPMQLKNASLLSRSTPNILDAIDCGSSSSSSMNLNNENNNNNNKTKFKHRFQDRLRRFFIGNGPRSSSISNHVSNNDGRSVRIKYFKYNASYRKAQRGKHRQPIIYQLLEPIPVRKEEFPSSIININNNNNNNNNNHGHQQKIDQSKSSKMPTNQFLMEQASLIYEDFGVQFINRNHKYLIELAFQQQQSLTYCEDFTKNLAGTVQELALRVLQTDVNRLQQQLFRLSPLSMNCESINIVADTNSSSYIIPMPNFSKNRKTFPSLISKNENRSIIIFGGNLTTLHVRDNERNKKDLDVPSILKHMIDYLGDNGVQEEGIFRVPGTKNRLNKLEEELTDLYMNYYKLNKPDNSKEINTIFERYNVHDVASLLKLFIRRLSPPLLTNELMDIFLMVPKIPNIFVSIKILNLLMLTLNDTHRNSLNALLILSNKVVRFMNYNLISLDGIATLLAANLFDCGSLSYNRNNPNQTSPAMNGVNQKRPSISTATTTTIESMMIGSPIQGAGGGGVGVGGSPKQSSIDHHRTSVSSQLVNEISMEMATQLERTQNSLFVLKLLINLQPILFHLPPYLERQIHEKVEEKKVQINQLFNT
ncbi:hypothetical protein HUG17_3880 [Dermatophagoides farinae]|uniref:Rho-GAP domain-containing protein n=1 Tax=Dermatophagoides farinae TaxID=6954 RepID=A0A9D4SF83_DERFA|nr:MATH and LRR domain-containing protein PFE0570w-like [Dermatophagoides farinae]KAH7639847.1 hypothetical protein HUG17_3880 [Dermatophagoides farinae]